MTQNTSHAVMSQRSEPIGSRDDFPTPPWAVRALCEHVLFHGEAASTVARLTAWEPACGRGYMGHALEEYFGHVVQSDIHKYRPEAKYKVHDFLGGEDPNPRWYRDIDWIITNPPFLLAEAFYRRARLIRPRHGFALLCRSNWMEGIARFENIFQRDPPNIIAQHVERVPMVRGRYDPKASSATAYAWFVWSHTLAPQQGRTRLVWIPPGSRRRYYREGDEHMHRSGQPPTLTGTPDKIVAMG